MADTLDWIQRNEPETLQFEVYLLTQAGDDGANMSLFERSVRPLYGIIVLPD